MLWRESVGVFTGRLPFSDLLKEIKPLASDGVGLILMYEIHSC